MKYGSAEEVFRDASVYPAHIRETEEGCEVQTVKEHLLAVAGYARDALQDVGLGNTAYLAGLLHDIGKYTVAFKQYIVDGYSGKGQAKGSVNHTFAGARYILDRHHGNEDGYKKLASEFVAYAVGAHHGMFDCLSPDGENGFIHRMQKDDPDIDEAVEHFRKEADQEEIDRLMALSAQEIKNQLKHTTMDRGFQGGLMARLLLSAVIEGDRRDTAEFEHGLVIDPPKADFAYWKAKTDAYVGAFSCDTEINRCRKAISDGCAAVLAEEGQIYKLNIPTGGGKTLSSLRFALKQTAENRHKRILYVIPLLSIIDQNAKVLREAIGEPKAILEHHSNVVISENSECDKKEILCETWDSPIVITTLVQLLNVLFSDKTTAIRRMQSLCHSVIIFDEVQTVPMKMLSLFNEAIHFLAAICKATVVLCSATQPTLDIAHHQLMDEVKDIFPIRPEMRKVFKRTEIVYRNQMSTAELFDYAKLVLEDCNSLLVICNTKAVAIELASKLRNVVEDCFYLSTSMCMEHRRNVLEKIRAVKKIRKTVCVSTQVVEAGVDISFERVIRLNAGLDSIIQAAGRCNRNAEATTPQEVSVVGCTDESLTFLQDIREGKQASTQLFSRTDNGDVISDKSVRMYYNILYNDIASEKGRQDYPVKTPNGTKTLFKMLSDNDKAEAGGDYYLCQAFRTAGEYFKVFDSEMFDIVVPYGEGNALISELYSERASRDMRYLYSIIQKLKPYTISVFAYQKDKLITERALEKAPAGILVLSSDWYDGEQMGLLDEPNYKFLCE